MLPSDDAPADGAGLPGVAEIVARFEKVDRDWGMKLTRLVDGVSTYEARAAGETREFDNTDDLYDWIAEVKTKAKERVVAQAIDAVRALLKPPADVAGLIPDIANRIAERLPDLLPIPDGDSLLDVRRAIVDVVEAALARGAHGGSAGVVPDELRELFDHAIRAGGPSPECREFSAAAVRFVEDLCRNDLRARIEAEDRARPASGATGEGGK